MNAAPHIRHGTRSGFSLLELLVVMVIIGILMAMLVPVVKKLLLDAKKNQCSAEAEEISSAVHAYFHEYHRLPLADNMVHGNENQYEYHDYEWFNDVTDAVHLAQVYSFLTGSNPKEIVFLQRDLNAENKKRELPQNGVFYDPWKNPYLLYLDVDYDGSVNIDTTTNHSWNSQVTIKNTRVLVRSWGPNKDYDTLGWGTCDDIIAPASAASGLYW